MSQLYGSWRRTMALTSAALAMACTPGLPSVRGVPATAPGPDRPWAPSARDRDDARRAPAVPRLEQAGVADTVAPPTAAPQSLADLLDLGLRNNPSTKQTWFAARAAASAYGASRGTLLPQVDGTTAVNRIQTAARSGLQAVQQTVYGPSAQLTWLLLDAGGRAGAMENARQTLLAADWTHNATVQAVTLQIAGSYFGFRSAVAAESGLRASLVDAERNLAAAEERRRVGVATIADVLQARTAVAQARLLLETAHGDAETARGNLAASVGWRADAPMTLAAADSTMPVGRASDSVGVIIDRALRDRPDLAAGRAQARAQSARARQLKSARLPSLQATGNGSYTYSNTNHAWASAYNIGLGLSIPLFNGLQREYAQRQAEELAAAAAASAEVTERVVAQQVFASYQALETATRRVSIARELLDAAQASTDVAAGRYREGVGTILDLLSAQAALSAARTESAQSHWAWATALAQLTHDAGVLDPRGTTLPTTPTDSVSAPKEPGR